ncbi:hypothetical protein [Nonomuraea salmonea]|uniref:Small CPxCG-related zinc finger protein n=1 Tax=Nonomuraea salmonea TaxID=46181 RepID=A0ABV5P2Y5_9ACTN
MTASAACPACGQPVDDHTVGELATCEHEANPQAHARPSRYCKICVPIL